MLTIPRAITEFREADDVNLTLTDKLVVNYDSGSDKFVTASVLSILGSQTANKVLASPDGSSGNSSFRALVVADLPTGITNAKLQNSSVTITAGTGMSGGGPVSLGSSVTLTNAGVTSFNTRTGAVTLTLSDLTSLAVDTRYHVLAGVAGGQIGYGGTGSADPLTFSTTSHATKGILTLGTYLKIDEANAQIKFGDHTGYTDSIRDYSFYKSGGMNLKLACTSANQCGLILGTDASTLIQLVRFGGSNDLSFYAGAGTGATFKYSNSYWGFNNSSPANRVAVNAITTADTLAQLIVGTGSTTNKGVVIQGVASQTANMLEVQKSDGSVVLAVGQGKFAVFAATPAVQQTGGAATASGTYGATEQTMLQAAYNCLRTFGFLN